MKANVQMSKNAVVWGAILFVCSSIRHGLFHSTAYDLGWYDQAIYLISQGQTPIISFWGHHILGDHVSLIFYPLALLYKIVPDVHWLFLVQAVSLALAGWVAGQIALQAGLKATQAEAIAIACWLYPLVFNLNLFDFHVEAIAFPALLGAVWSARSRYRGGFGACLLLVLSCRAVLSLTVAAMGVWLFACEKRRWYGAIALGAGVAWFLIATQVAIPFFSGGEALGTSRYAFLGDSVGEIILNLFLKPGIVFKQLFTSANFGYLLLFFAPLIWGLSPRHLAPLIAALPTFAMNLLAESDVQKDLLHQYSLPALPFLLLSVIAAIAAGKGWFRRRRWIVLWAIAAFLVLAKFSYFSSKYLQHLDTWQATREAVSLVQPQGGVLTTAHLAPHLTHRPLVRLTLDRNREIDLDPFDSILLDLRHPGWESSPETAKTFFIRAQQHPDFQLQYQQDGVYLWTRLKLSDR